MFPAFVHGESFGVRSRLRSAHGGRGRVSFSQRSGRVSTGNGSPPVADEILAKAYYSGGPDIRRLGRPSRRHPAVLEFAAVPAAALDNRASAVLGPQNYRYGRRLPSRNTNKWRELLRQPMDCAGGGKARIFK